MINQVESDESGDDEEDNITFLARKLNRFLKKQRGKAYKEKDVTLWQKKKHNLILQ